VEGNYCGLIRRLYRHVPGSSEENPEISNVWLRFKPSTSQIQSSIAASANLFGKITQNCDSRKYVTCQFIHPQAKPPAVGQEVKRFNIC
jgi:pantothenate kinase